jgi:hypothetical protein
MIAERTDPTHATISLPIPQNASYSQEELLMATFRAIVQAKQPTRTSGKFTTAIKTGVTASAMVLNFLLALGSERQVLAQKKQGEPREPMEGVKYESIAPGLVAARIFMTDAQRDVIIEVKDFILGPGKSAPDLLKQGIGIMELKSGEVETTIDGQTSRRRPSDYWVVGAAQRCSVKNSGGQAVIHAFILTRK